LACAFSLCVAMPLWCVVSPLPLSADVRSAGVNWPCHRIASTHQHQIQMRIVTSRGAHVHVCVLCVRACVYGGGGCDIREKWSKNIVAVVVRISFRIPSLTADLIRAQFLHARPWRGEPGKSSDLEAPLSIQAQWPPRRAPHTARVGMGWSCEMRTKGPK